MNVYDFDKTIYNGDSTIDFYLFCLKKKPSLIRFLPAQAWGFALYAIGSIAKTALKERFFCFVKGMDAEQSVQAFWAQNASKVADWYIQQQSAYPSCLMKHEHVLSHS